MLSRVVLFGLGFSLALFIACYSAASDSASCTIWNSHEDPAANGYYAATGGQYLRRGRPGLARLQPVDFFGIMSWRQFTSPLYSLQLGARGWTVVSREAGAHGSGNGGVLFYNKLTAQANEGVDEYLFSPPEEGWVHMSLTAGPGGGGSFAETPSALRVGCSGSLSSSGPTAEQKDPASAGGNGQGANAPSNLQQMWARPVTSLLLLALCSYAYHMYRSGTDPSTVSFSYQKVYLEGEWYRLFTAAGAHFDLMHLGFNCMTLYQLGGLEEEYGSLTYAYLSFDLVVYTGLACVLLTYFMVARLGRVDMLQQQAVGYSCVLFAWITVAAVRMGGFCPVIFVPNFCFNTFTIPLIGLPVNFGPVILLFITKIIIPQSSFLGHLAGIVIGLPLSWALFPLEVGVSGGAEQWFGCGHPFWTCSALLAAYLFSPYTPALTTTTDAYTSANTTNTISDNSNSSDKLYVWRFPYYEAESFSLAFFAAELRRAVAAVAGRVEEYRERYSTRQHSGNTYAQVNNHAEDASAGNGNTATLATGMNGTSAAVPLRAMDTDASFSRAGAGEVTHEAAGEHGTNLDCFVSTEQLHLYNEFKYISFLAIVLTALLVSIIFFLLFDVTGAEDADSSSSRFLFTVNFLVCYAGPRALWLFLLWSAHHAKRISYFTDNAEVSRKCIQVLVLAAGYSALLAVETVSSIGAYVGSYAMINSDTSDGFVNASGSGGNGGSGSGRKATAIILVFSVFSATVCVVQCLLLLRNIKTCKNVERSEVLHFMNLTWLSVLIDSV